MIEGGVSASDVGVEYDPFAGPALDRIVPSTEAQREVWLASRLSREASLAYNESITLRLAGELDPAALQAAVDGLVARHESLRATFGPDGTTMCVAAAQPVPIAASDLRGLEPSSQGLAVERLLHHAVEDAFDLGHGPLLRVQRVALAAELNLIVLTAHHIVCDGWSFGVIIRDLGSLYARHLSAPQGAAVVDERGAAASFADYALAHAAHEQSAAGLKDANYWLQRFANVPAPLELPIDRPRRARRSFASQRTDFVLDAALVERLRRLAARDGASLYSMLLGGFAALLHRLGGGDDLVIGVPTAGQSETGFGEVVGHCVNLLPLRVPVQPTQSVRDMARTAQSALLDAFEHQRFTYGTLLKKLVLSRDPARLPLVSVMFNLDQAFDTDGSGFPGLTLDVKGNARTHENFELFVNAVQESGALRLECQFNSDLFDEQSVRRSIGGYEQLLQGACETPDRPLGELDVVVPADRALLAQWNATALPFSRTLSVHDLIEAQVARTPERIALLSGAVGISYRELDERAALIAGALRTRGVGPGARVGLCAGRSAGMVAAMLGVLKAGAAYVPLDPSYPADRISHMVDDAGLALLITEPAYAAQFSWPAANCLLLRDSGAPIEPVASSSLAAPRAAIPTESPAYVIYTSGSTGKPKGVVVPHRAVVNFLTSMARQPGLDGDDTLLAVTTLSFDIAVTELLLPLTVGARIVLATREDAIDPARLRELIETQRVSVMQATPSTWRMLVDADWRGGPEFKALCGGEPLSADLARELGARTGSLWNMYGPTETTVWSTLSAIVKGAPSIDIGVPIANTSVWILNERAGLCPVGVPGEIVIGGDGVTLGYLNRPELTDDRFIADPFTDPPHSLMYRTGDRGRWRADGRLEHLGRLDHQVKVRGFRIEPGEIEAAVLADPGIARCVVIAREDRPGDVRLVAYLVARDAQPIDEASLRSRLKLTLPDYMLPQHLVGLPVIPLLPNGKVDRKALPAPASAATVLRRHVPPRSPTERVVASAMEAVLSLPELGAEDNFFALGGHSLLAAQFAASLASTTGRHVPMSAVFEAPTIAELAAWIDASSASPGPAASSVALPAGGDPDEAPASLMQQRVWFLEQLRPGTSTYNTPSAHSLSGPLDVAVLERSLNAVIERQAVLRTALVQREFDLVQQIAPVLNVSLQPVQDLGAIEPGRRQAELLELLQARAGEPIPTDAAPLFRIGLYRLAPEEHVLFFMPHHLIWDGWSFDIFYTEMAAFYAAFSGGVEPDLPTLTWRYGDFSRWQKQWLEGSDAQRQLAYWRERFAVLPEALALPLDRPRPAQMSGAGETQPIAWPASLVEQARAFGAARGATLFMTLLAVFALLLHRTTGQRDIVVGTPFRGRDRLEVEPVMGFFVNALPLRLTVDADQSFAALLAQVRVVVLEAFAAPDVPIERLVQALQLPRDESRTPLYQAFFSFQDARERQRDWGPLRQTQLHVFQKGAAEDLGVWLLDHGDGLAGGLTFATDLLLPVTAARTIARLEHLAKAALSDPECAVRELEFLVPDERRLLAEWNATGDSQPVAARSVAALLRAQAIRSPDRVALRCGEHCLSYQALDHQAARTARRLQAAGIGAGARVGIRLPRSVDLVVAVLGVLKAGAAYVPLAPVEAVRPAGLTGLALTIDARWWAAAQAGSASPTESSPDVQVDTQPDDAALVALARAPADVEPADGAPISQGSLLNLLASLARSPGLTEGDRWVAVTPFETDMAAVEILLPLAVGAELVLATADELRSGATLRTLLDACAPTAMQATPTTCQELLDAGWRGTPGFKMLVGGEPLSPALARALTAACDKVWYVTGLQQTGVWSTCGRLVPASLEGVVVPAGRPIRNTEVLILDPLGNECPIGVVGEVWIAGDDPAIGRPSSPAGADARLASPRVRSSQHVCRTGETGRWSADGALEWLGPTVRASVAARAPMLTNPGLTQAVIEPRMSDSQQKVAALWQEVLGTSDIGPADNFFDLGGHSLLAMRVVSQMQSRLGLVVPLRRLIYESLAQIAATPSTPIDAVSASPVEAPVGGLLNRVFGRFGRRT